MKHGCHRKALIAALLFLGLGSSGCEQVVGDAARSSLASFLTAIATTAIDHAVNGE